MKKFKYGNTTVIIHSPLVHLTSEERREWFESEKKKGNPILKEIADVITEIYINKALRETEKEMNGLMSN